MAPIDVMQPNVEDEIQDSRNLNEITRKTKDNIVNVDHELKAEEFAWYFLFPYGKNGFKEERSEKITALDYFQFRILGSDTRFQRNDYLFYALSFFEYYRIKSTISACGKKIVNQEGAIEDVHLYFKNLRGSAAYWRSALNELLAQIRCLGAPTYFVTFSSNDLNFLDQRKTLLIADGRPDVDPSTLDIYEIQQLIEKYPAILSRHFMVRVNALMKFIKNNDEVFGGKVKDHWWRIEFQNRGSPHLHMVVGIEIHPEFDTEEGKLLLDRNCCCKMPTEEDPELYELVKKCQIHRHTQTCTKNNTSVRCRFNFPRQECDETRIVSHSSDDFLRDGGRICLLKRRKEDAWVNNFHPQLLRLWTGNMDIQPCGSNETIAYYITKYLSKAEPEGVDSGIAQAIQQIQREESDISRKLFRICMKILHERQVSAAECAYRLCHIPLRDSSRSCIFLNTRKSVLHSIAIRQKRTHNWIL
ncbi:ATP-dependent DNA helicase [Caerostris darwini]|uniref:ATP-dependent DNA helicase n=1 Tax=Caerostris darwini TaxID=1538125 RepID=A0AAV4R2Q6_9ARAC|nr:ATP-dependent DNA helicase [Caerostris darwini]